MRLAADYGPADLGIAIVTGQPSRWSWARWLPHAGRSVESARIGPCEELLADASVPPSASSTIVVIDDPGSLLDGGGVARRLLDAGASGLLLAGQMDQVPACCGEVLLVEPDATGVLRRPGEATPVHVAGVSEATARRVSRRLARFSDPEQHDVVSAVPDEVRLAELIGEGAVDPEALAARWAMPSRPAAPIGVGADGVVEVDLVRDGPHALIVGTTGAGKSELLRALVAGLAVCHPPTELTFLLVDYKGGSAFDACATLPHVVGVVTDLDDHLAPRALRSLEAELRRREAVLRAAGVADLGALAAASGDEPLPRLVVVIDEFAALSAELPGFIPSIVGVAQRGRSLGVHLVLATQRPGPAVTDDIRANTNLRIALRVQEPAESVDVVGVPVAAGFPHGRPGRAALRLGASEVVVFQSACTALPARAATRPVDVHPLGRSRSTDAADGPSELARLVDACVAAAAALSLPSPRRPWLDPLPALVPLAELPLGTVALADDPDHQAQLATGWNRHRGHLLLTGSRRSGRTSALASLAVDLARRHSPEALHLLVADLGAGTLAPLQQLPHVGAVVLASEPERLARLARVLERELERRLAEPGCHPELVVLIDGVDTLRATFDAPPGYEHLDRLARVLAEGPNHGVTAAMTADAAAPLPSSLTAGISQRWLFALADAAAWSDAGLTSLDRPPPVPGRARAADSGLELQIGHPGRLPDQVAELAKTSSTPTARPSGVGTMPSRVDVASLPPPHAVMGVLHLAVGIGDTELEPAVVSLHRGEHVVIAGPARSGRSTALALFASLFRRAAPDAWIGLIAPRPSVASELTVFDAVHAISGGMVLPEVDRRVVLVDDAELVDDPGWLGEGLAARDPSLVVVVAARPDALRAAYGHWTQLARRSRLGVLLWPDPLIDGDLLGASLPRHAPLPRRPGRGYLVAEGHAELVQLAVASSVPARRAQSRRRYGTGPGSPPTVSRSWAAAASTNGITR